MKQLCFSISLVTCLMFHSILFADGIDIKVAKQVAENKISQLTDNSNYQINNEKTFYQKNETQQLFFVFELSPCGYIVISADTNLPPVIAYSFENNYSHNENNPLEKMLIADLTNRKKNISDIPVELISQRNMDWEKLTQSNSNITKSGKEKDDILIQTNWGQGAPYNNFCPMDPVTNQRSIAGCPAVAMAQIVNYYKTINETVFNDQEDDYYHSYAGRNYWIDDDHMDRDFPDFPQINAYLDTLVQCWENQSSLKTNEKAALNFACGIAATQVYTSEASGTFGVDQAFDAYMRFGFTEAVLMDDSDTSLYTKLAQNMMDGRPAHLAVVDPGWTMGHNVVVDGYTEEGYFHLNFGWNGSYNGFYLLPDEIPYGLTVIEGVVLNIAYPPTYTDIPQENIETQSNELTIFPNPALDHITFDFTIPESGSLDIRVYNQKGALVFSSLYQNLKSGGNGIRIDFNQTGFPELQSGIYFCTATSKKQTQSGKFIIR